MKNQILFIVIAIIVVVLGIFIFSYEGSPEVPVVGENGEIDGEYSVLGVMELNKPFTCTFEKREGSASVLGNLRINGTQMLGEFRISSPEIPEPFTSFLIVNEDKAHSWTSLQNVGYRTKPAKSASRNASPVEQAQILGTRDIVPLKCSPWANPDETTFEPPSWIVFTDL